MQNKHKQQTYNILNQFTTTLLNKSNTISNLDHHVSPIKITTPFKDADQDLTNKSKINIQNTNNFALKNEIYSKILAGENTKSKKQTNIRQNHKKSNKSFCNPQLLLKTEQNDLSQTKSNQMLFDKQVSCNQIIVGEKPQGTKTSYFKQRYTNASKSKSPGAKKSCEKQVSKQKDIKSQSKHRQEKEKKSTLSQQIINQAKSILQTPNKELQIEENSKIRFLNFLQQKNDIDTKPQRSEAIQLRTPSNSSKNTVFKYTNSSPINESQIKTAQSPQSPLYQEKTIENKQNCNSERHSVLYCQNHAKKAKYATEKGVFLCSKCAIAFAQFINLIDIDTYMKKQNDNGNFLNFSKLLEQSGSGKANNNEMIDTSDFLNLLRSQHEAIRKKTKDLNDQKKIINLTFQEIQQKIEQRFLNLEREMIKQKNQIINEISVLANEKNQQLDVLSQSINSFMEIIASSIQELNISTNSPNTKSNRTFQISNQITSDFAILVNQIKQSAQWTVPSFQFKFEEESCLSMMTTTFFILNILDKNYASMNPNQRDFEKTNKKINQQINDSKQTSYFHSELEGQKLQNNTKNQSDEFIQEVEINQDPIKIIQNLVTQQTIEPKEILDFQIQLDQRDISNLIQLKPFVIEQDIKLDKVNNDKPQLFETKPKVLFQDVKHFDDIINQNALRDSHEINNFEESVQQFSSFSNSLLKQQKPKKYLEQETFDELKDGKMDEHQYQRISQQNELLQESMSDMYTSQQKTTKFDQLFSSPQFQKS